MKPHYISKANDNMVLWKKAVIARSFWQRLRGLMGRSLLDPDEALIFYHATSFHTFFMRFPIDIIFLDREAKIIRIASNLVPFRCVNCFGASCAIEVTAHQASQKGLAVGDTLEIKPS